jgi:8-oxo-dGTP pyrophosphatase MutT (NUDIX family)
VSGLAASSQRVLADEGFLRIVEKLVSDGSRVERRVVVEHPGAVVLVPVLATRRVVMVRQFRASVEREMLELPAGKRDVPGESAIETAARELKEECGLRASSLVEIGRFLNSPGFTNEETVVVLATGLAPSQSAPQSLEEAAMSLEIVDLETFSVLEDAKSVLGLEMARRYLQAHPERLGDRDDPAMSSWLSRIGPTAT